MNIGEYVAKDFPVADPLSHVADRYNVTVETAVEKGQVVTAFRRRVLLLLLLVAHAERCDDGRVSHATPVTPHFGQVVVKSLQFILEYVSRQEDHIGQQECCQVQVEWIVRKHIRIHDVRGRGPEKKSDHCEEERICEYVE